MMATHTNMDTPREMVGNAADRAKDMTMNVADKAKNTAANLAEKAKDTASNLADKTKDTAANVTHKAEELAKTAGRKADDATAAVGSSIRSAADTVRDKGPHDGLLGSATSATAGALESTGRYLEQEKLSGMAEDMTNLVRRNPIPALLVAAGVGFLIGRALRS
jgi:ElaB/YqjD/DUF883 family membrane-anchored ribosome-binding protein